MREEIEKLIVESYECGNISLEEANILMEMSSATLMKKAAIAGGVSGDVGAAVAIAHKKQKTKEAANIDGEGDTVTNESDNTNDEKKAKRNKALKTIGKIAGAGVGGGLIGYGGYKIGKRTGKKESDEENAQIIEELKERNNDLRDICKLWADETRYYRYGKR